MSAGQIHDLGYKRYVGTRRSIATRWTVIMRHQIASGWKTWWRFKIWLVAGVLVTGIAIALQYALNTRTVGMITAMGGGRLHLGEAVLPLSPIGYCKAGFMASLFVAVSAVAGDLQSGAFTFYFVRSVRPRDYVLGKLAGLAALMSLIMLVGPLLLAIARLGLADSSDQLISLLPVLPRALAIGVLGTLIYAAVPLGFSALAGSRGQAMALWAIYYVVVGLMVELVAQATSPALAALDLTSALQAVSNHLFEVQFAGRRSLDIPVGVALGSILGHAALAIGAVFWRVRSAQHGGVGGSS